jgi:hypothetical protein
MNLQQENFEDYLQQDFPRVLQKLHEEKLAYRHVIQWEERHWKEFAGIGEGKTIFNYLHPSPAAIHDCSCKNQRQCIIFSTNGRR